MADRAILETDALGNQTMTTFDNNGNPVIVQLTELGTITQPKQAPESFGTVNKFDRWMACPTPDWVLYPAPPNSCGHCLTWFE